MEGWTSVDWGKRFNGSVTIPGSRLVGEAWTWAKANRRAVRRKEKEWLSCIVTVDREKFEEIPREVRVSE